MINVTDLRNGTVFEDSSLGKEPYAVVKYEHIKMARGGAVVKLKVKGLKTGVTKAASFKSNDKVAEADIIKKTAQYLYSDSSYAYFMDAKSFEQESVPLDIVGKDFAKFLKGGEEIMVMLYENSIISAELPKTVTLKVEYTEPGFKGDSSTTVLKPATLENDLNVQVPLFVKVGDIIKIKTENKEYAGKV